MDDFLKFLGGFLGIVVGTIFYAFVFNNLWTWFIVPTFYLPKLSLPVAYGITLTVRFMVVAPSKDDRGIGELIILSIVWSALILFLGWIVHFMA